MQNDTKKKDLYNKIVQTVKTVYDPEIPVDIWELGLIYKIEINDDFTVDIKMTLTSPNCPVAESLPTEVYEKVKKVDAVKDVNITLVFEPSWNQEMISDEGLLELGLL
ncbi:MAG: iron-sulfur cluster assembly protein [Bacteroidales bacterium]|jgi:FeS assembly SUF system protein